MINLLQEISKCKVCEPHLAFGANPVVTAHPKSKIIIIGQAPGSKVHNSGIPWDDKSGENLRTWLHVNKNTFYDSENIALVPMGFCYPGKGKSGDLPPRPECAPLWHKPLIDKMTEARLVLLIGQYAQAYYLKDRTRKTLTETVRNFEEYLPNYFVLPHPSPRNNIWLAKNDWFKKNVIPQLQAIINNLLH